MMISVDRLQVQQGRRQLYKKYAALITEGDNFIKYCRRAKPRYKFVCVSPDLKEIHWASTKRANDSRTISAASILRVRRGQKTKVFHRSLSSDYCTWDDPVGDIESRSFSLIFPNRTLDLVAKTAEQREIWVEALKWVMSINSEIGSPFAVHHVTHVDQEYKWMGQDLRDTFDIMEKLGEGSFGVVHRAVHKEVQYEVAVKMVKNHDDQQTEFLKKEIDILKSLRNENIVEYLGWWGPDSRNRLWILTDYCHLGSIIDCFNVARYKPNEAQIACICASILRGLAYLHSRKVIHRDIKGRNILINRDGIVKLADFGVSREVKEDMTYTTTIAGSPHHMAPEVIKQQTLNFKSDIWAVGITALELANGKPPHSHLNPIQAAAIIATSEPPILEGDDCSDHFKDFVAKCLIRDPSERPSASSLLKHPFVCDVVSNEALLEVITVYYEMLEMELSDSHGTSTDDTKTYDSQRLTFKLLQAMDEFESDSECSFDGRTFSSSNGSSLGPIDDEVHFSHSISGNCEAKYDITDDTDTVDEYDSDSSISSRVRTVVSQLSRSSSRRDESLLGALGQSSDNPMNAFRGIDNSDDLVNRGDKNRATSVPVAASGSDGDSDGDAGKKNSGGYCGCAIL